MYQNLNWKNICLILSFYITSKLQLSKTEILMNSRFVKNELIDMAKIVDLLAQNLCE